MYVWCVCICVMCVFLCDVAALLRCSPLCRPGPTSGDIRSRAQQHSSSSLSVHPSFPLLFRLALCPSLVSSPLPPRSLSISRFFSSSSSLSVHLSFCLCQTVQFSLRFCLSVHFRLCVSICPPLYFTPSITRSVSLSLFLSVYLSYLLFCFLCVHWCVSP